MTYSNISADVTQSTIFNGSGDIAFYSNINLISGIPHSAQVVVDRVFQTEATGSVDTLAEFLNSPNVSSFHKKNIYRIPNSRITFNSNLKIITAVNLPQTGDVYNYTAAAGFSVKVPYLTINEVVTVTRKTISNVPLVTWLPGSKLTSVQLNQAMTQVLFLSQELLSTIETAVVFAGTATTTLTEGAVTGLIIADNAISANHITLDTQAWDFNGTMNIDGVVTLGNLSASQAVFTNASDQLVSVATSGSGSVVLTNGAVLTNPSFSSPPTFDGTNITGTATNFTSTSCTTVPQLTGDVTTNGSTNATTIVSLGNVASLGVTGNATVSGTLGVTGSSTFGNDVSITGNLDVTGSINSTSTNTIVNTAVDKTFYLGASPADFTGSISGTTLTITAFPVGVLSIGSLVTWSGQSGTTPRVTAVPTSGTQGDGGGYLGLYTLDTSITQSSIAMTGTGNTDAGISTGGIVAMGSSNFTHSLQWVNSPGGTGYWTFNTADARIETGRNLIVMGGNSNYKTSFVNDSAYTEDRTLTLPAGNTPGTLVTRTSTDTLTNKTFEATATGNVLKFTTTGSAVTSETGTGAVVRAANPTITNLAVSLASCTNYPVASVANLGTGVATFLTTPSSANLAAAVTGETGSGALVFADGPVFSTPTLGTPTTSSFLTNCTNLPIVNGTTGTLTVARGGTGISDNLTSTSSNTGILLVSSSTTSLTTLQLPASSQGKVLTINNAGTGIEWAPSAVPTGAKQRSLLHTQADNTSFSLSYLDVEEITVLRTAGTVSMTLTLTDIPVNTSVFFTYINAHANSINQVTVSLGAGTSVTELKKNHIVDFGDVWYYENTVVDTSFILWFLDITHQGRFVKITRGSSSNYIITHLA